MKKLILGLIKFYQKTLSPDHGFIFLGGAIWRCRFFPSCSQYTREAISRYGVMKGVFMGVWRILRCNPFSKGGIDFI
jgi:putative membrane protein insertion efficiency factor